MKKLIELIKDWGLAALILGIAVTLTACSSSSDEDRQWQLINYSSDPTTMVTQMFIADGRGDLVPYLNDLVIKGYQEESVKICSALVNGDKNSPDLQTQSVRTIDSIQISSPTLIVGSILYVCPNQQDNGKSIGLTDTQFQNFSVKEISSPVK